MINLIELLSAYPVWTVLLIAVASFIVVFKIIDWCKKTWEKRGRFRQEAILEGEKLQQQEDAEKKAKEDLEKRVKALEDNLGKLTTILENQEKILTLLKDSDELDIKTWIKAQHDKWVPTGCIDSQALELICQRYAIYREEGGNSWAERLVEDLKSLTIVTNIPL